MGCGLAFLLVDDAPDEVLVSLHGPQAVLHTWEFPLAAREKFCTLQICYKKAETSAFQLLIPGT